ncbi:MAG: cyclic nucleotide-binding domain-containing protein [Candidatus Tectomicrobia bacterium]|nr:cyclic nucleotide-binding domain-containing protein [Candidatus Tectomicrobia bacterium]
MLEKLEKYEKRSVEAGTIIFNERDSADSMFIVVNGRVDISKKIIEGSEKILATLGAGEYFGEMGLLTGARRSATARAIEDTELIEIDQDVFMALLQDEPSIGIDLMRQLAQRLEKTNEDLIYLALEMALSERKPMRFEGPLDNNKMIIMATGSFDMEKTHEVLKARKHMEWPHHVDVIASLFRAGRTRDALVYVIATDDYKQIMNLVTHYKGLVQWDFSLALSIEDDKIDEL